MTADSELALCACKKKCPPLSRSAVSVCVCEVRPNQSDPSLSTLSGPRRAISNCEERARELEFRPISHRAALCCVDFCCSFSGFSGKLGIFLGFVMSAPWTGDERERKQQQTFQSFQRRTRSGSIRSRLHRWILSRKKPDFAPPHTQRENQARKDDMHRRLERERAA